jgi:hypothetical protein
VKDARDDAQLAADVPCYGRFWDPEEPACIQECTVQERCVSYIARIAIPRIVETIGKPLTEVTARELTPHGVEVSTRALQWLREVNASSELGLPVRAPDGSLVAPPKAPAEEEQMVERKKGARNPPKPRAEKGQSRGGKEARRKGGASLAQRGLRRRKPLQQWGVHTYPKRWQRERESNPFVGRIPIGWTLQRVWKGELHTVTSRTGYWEYQRSRYPTLYSVVAAITGHHDYPGQVRNGKREGVRAGTAWSARKFFFLDRLLEEAGLHPNQEAERPRPDLSTDRDGS